MNRQISKALAVASVAMAFSCVAANEWFVDDDNYGKQGLDGRSEATAFGTIQDAIDCNDVKAGDTVTVLPGTYDRGFSTYTDSTMPAPYTAQPLTNRVNISKAITIRSKEGADVTHIVGAPQPDSAVTNANDYGVGPAAIRCVMAVKNSLLQGFTLREGRVHTVNFGTDNTANQGGGYRGDGVIVDCVISNCVGTRGGAMRNGTAVRCRIVNNLTTSGTAVARDTTLVNSFIAQNRCFINPKGNHCFRCKFYNCTIVDNADTPFLSSDCELYNTIQIGNDKPPAQGMAESYHCMAYNSVLPTNDAESPYFDPAEDCAVGDNYYFFAPLFGDYRLLPGSPAVGLGDAAHLAALKLPEGIDPYVDLDGQAIPKTGRIAAGCCQAVGPNPVAGVYIQSEIPLSVDGRGAGTVAPVDSYAFTDSAAVPQLFRLRPLPPEGRYLYGFQHPSSSANAQEPPLMDESLWCAFPPTGVYTTKVLVAKNAFWVDPETGVNDNDHGTEEAPFKTIQQAIRKTKDGSLTVIHCAAGEYREDGEMGNGVTSRVYVTSANACLRIKGAGRDRSFIYGTHDDDATYHDGRGTKAARCVHIASSSNRSCVQGFTLVDGATLDGTENNDSYNGGGFLAHNANGQLADCTIDNCIGYRGGATKSGTTFRCIITNCPAPSGGMTRDTKMFSTLVYGCKLFPDESQKKRNGPIFGNGCHGRQVTTYGNAESDAIDGNNHALTNSLFAMTPGVPINQSFKVCSVAGCVFGNMTNGSPDAPMDGRFVADPCFSDPANGDFALMAVSAAVDGGRTADYWKYPLADVYGNPLRFYRGTPMAGAVHTQPVPSVAIGACSTGTMTVTPTLPKTLAPGESVTVSVTVTGATRPVFGFKVTGDIETVVTNVAQSMTFTAPTTLTDDAIGRFMIEPLVTSDWYVSPDGDDDNDGFSPLTPFATLKKSMENANLVSGDTVHALPGVYSNGTMAVDKDCSYGYEKADKSTPVRVRVKAGVTLVADEGPEKTIIKGEFTSAADGGNMNRGAKSVRCAALYNTATLQGFTLTGGSVTQNSNENEVNSGGAVVAPGASTTAIISDCIISNNYAYRGAAAYGGYFRRCKILANYSSGNPISIGRAGAENCFIDDNWGSTETIRFPNGLYNCTIGIRNRKNQADAKAGSDQIQIQDGQNYKTMGAFNCIVMGHDATASGKDLAATNCIFMSGYKTNLKDRCVAMTEEEIALNADGTLGANSKAIGFGCNDFLDKMKEPATDLSGGQRIYNVTVDAGCSEFDYRPVFAAAMGAGITVTNASSEVTLTDGKVTLTDGATISGIWATLQPQKMTRYSCEAAASGEGGTLEGFVGERVLSLAEGAAKESFKARGAEAFDFGFAYAGEGSGAVWGFEQYVPGVLLLVR